jgi:hypothetical protein
MTGTIPFNQYGNAAVILKVSNGVRPERPTHAEILGLTDAVWGLTEACWNQQWNERPPISTVLSVLKEASMYWNPPSATTASFEIESHDTLYTLAHRTLIYIMPSNDIDEFRSVLRKCRNIVAIAGAGLSAASGAVASLCCTY